MHFPAVGHLILTDDGDVVFALAGHNTGTATHAGIQVNGHTPLMNFTLGLGASIVRVLVNLFGLTVGIMRDVTGVCLEIHVLSKITLGLEIFQVCLAHNGATFHGPVILGARNGMGFVEPPHFGTRGKVSSLASP